MTSTDRDIDRQLRAWRRDLHRIPETAFEEHLTSTYVATALEGLGFDVARGIGGTGVVGSLSRGTSARAIGLRADMDGLPLQEVDGRQHGSTHPGVMHACGHDGHMAMVLGAAAVLAGDQHLDGTVRVIFQPAEEPGRGAQAMIDDGLFERFPIDALYGLHNLPGVPAGHLHTRAGGIMASEDNFEIVITGRGGHAARPEAGHRPARRRRGDRPGAADHRGPQRRPGAPGRGVLHRAFIPTEPATRSRAGRHPRRHPQLQPRRPGPPGGPRCAPCRQGIAAAHGATCDVSYTHEFEPTVNDPPGPGGRPAAP